MTAIICTRDRPDLLSRALASVVAEIGPEDEVVVVDDGIDGEVVPPLPCIRLLRTWGVGAAGARAVGLAAARGVFVAWCDDDDLWLPGHVNTLTTVLIEQADVDLVYGDAELEVPGSAGPPSVPYALDFEENTLAGWNFLPISAVMHRTHSARSAGGFDGALSAFEDWDLWQRMVRRGCLLRRAPAVVARQRWQQTVNSALYWEDASKVAERNQPPAGAPATAFDPSTWTEGRELVCRAIMRPNEGYGVVGRQLLLALARRGVRVSLSPERDQYPADVRALRRPVPGRDRLGFYYDYRRKPQELGCDRVVLYTMCESTGVPEDVLAAANASAYVLVPCEQNARDFVAAGVVAPVRVLHHGVDTGAFAYLTRPLRDTFTFGTFGHLSPRKGTDVLIQAFCSEFGPADDVRLVLKSSRDARAYEIDDPRIDVLAEAYDSAAMLRLIAGFDAFVLPSRGEGFGLCGLEAMATGLPLIATGWSGPSEYLDPADSLALEYSLVDANGQESNRTRYFGKWAEPDVDHLRVLMRWVYEHPVEAAAMGRSASIRVHRDWTWDRVAADLERHLDAAAIGADGVVH